MEGKSWIEDLKEQLLLIRNVDEEKKWITQSIFRVPSRIKDANLKMYEPQMVSIGPYHHDNPKLKPMEHQKRRALVRLLEKSKKPIEEYGAALESVVQQLMDAYEELEDVWRDEKRFLQMVMVDASFLLELLRGLEADYQPLDPIFSIHGIMNTFHYIVPDILMLENQLPLLSVSRLLSIERGISDREGEIATNSLVIKMFYAVNVQNPDMPLGLHVLDVFRKAVIFDPWDHIPFTPKAEVTKTVRSVTDLSDVGVVFKKSETMSIRDIRFEDKVLSIPIFAIEGGADKIFFNCIAFERLQPGSGQDISTYMLFMSGLVSTGGDAALLKTWGLIQCTLWSDEEVVKLLKSLSRDVFFDPSSRTSAVQDALNEYYKQNTNKLSKKLGDLKLE